MTFRLNKLNDKQSTLSTFPTGLTVTMKSRLTIGNVQCQCLIEEIE
jgi:hypothetical protein